MRVVATILLAALALVAAGCGGGGKSSTMTPLELVSQATSKTTKAASAKVHMTITETIGPIGPLEIGVDGVVDNSKHSGDMTIDMSSIAQIAGGAAGNANAWKGEVVVDGSNLSHVVEYMKLPVFSTLLPSAKPWLKVDLSELGKVKGIDFGQLLQSAGTQDPSQALQALQAIANVKEVGKAQVDGVDTTEYSGTVDPQKVAALLPKSAGLGRVFKQLGTKPIPVSAWIDGGGYIRKFEESFSMTATNAGRMDMKLAATFSDFGTPVSITIPPADQTTDILQLIKKK
jgi:hypothetical protein